MAVDDTFEEKGRRFRSPPYPGTSLPKAIERAGQLFSKAQHFSVGIPALADAWQLSAQSGNVLKIAAALIQYGLVSDTGTGYNRKFQLTEIARRILQDNDPSSEKQIKAIQTAALSPMIHGEIWNKFGSSENVSDAVLKTHLILDRAEEGGAPYSDSSALEVIQNYRDAIRYSNLSGRDSTRLLEEIENIPKGLDGSGTKLAKVDQSLVQNQAIPPRPAEAADTAFGTLAATSLLGRETDIKVLLDGNILRVNAVVDIRGIKRLIKVLTANLELLEDDS